MLRPRDTGPGPGELVAEPGLKPGISLLPEFQGSPNCLMLLNKIKGKDLGEEMGKACIHGEVKVVGFVTQGSWTAFQSCHLLAV